MNYTKDQLHDAFDQLPQEIREAIVSVDTSEKVQTIAKKHSLHIDQTGELGEEIGFAMMGLTHPTEFVKNIKDRLEIDNKIAEDIASDVNEEIFLPIKSSLQKMHDKKEEAEGNDFSKDEVLNAIENPPAVKPAWKPEAQPLIPKSSGDAAFTSSLGEVLPQKPSITEQKLSSVVNLQKQEQVFAGETAGSTPKEYRADPYREPAN